MSIKIHHSRIGTRNEYDEPKVDGFKQEKGSKPNGFWYQCEYYGDDEWKMGEGFGLIMKKHLVGVIMIENIKYFYKIQILFL